MTGNQAIPVMVPRGYQPISDAAKTGRLIQALETRPGSFRLYWAAWRNGGWRREPFGGPCSPTHWKAYR